MNAQSKPAAAQAAPDPQPILEIATGFMRSKHLFTAAEMGVFEALADGPRTIDELARQMRAPRRTARIVVDAVTALGLLQRNGDRYENGPVAQAFLSGSGAADMGAWLRFWNRLSYCRWLTLEDSVRLGRGVSGEFNFTTEEQQVFSEGVEAFSNAQAAALIETYNFSRHRRIMDLGGGTGSFLRAILQSHENLEGTLYELRPAAAVARNHLRGSDFEKRIGIIEGDFLKDPIPNGHDGFLAANVIHVLDEQQSLRFFRRVRASAANRARLLLVDFFTNATHTEPLFAALMAGEFLVVAGNGDVYSVDEMNDWLAQTGWRLVEHKPLEGPSSLIVAEAA
ncbi:MAG: hypothetical protein JOY54_09280 [Acidobacteriaceae bacterium]|nr:hypothetical protein [Acidobacteriaceae bacterium]